MASFKLTSINKNEESWGPTATTLPQKYNYLCHSPWSNPAQSLLGSSSQSSSQNQSNQQQSQQGSSQQSNKQDSFKMGKIFDFTTVQQQMQMQAAQHAKNLRNKKADADADAVSDDDEEFQSVTKKSGARGGRQGWQQSGNRPQRGGARGGYKKTGGRGGYNQRGGYGQRGAIGSGRQMQPKASVEVKPTWTQVSYFTFQDLSKVTVDSVPAATDLESAGFVEYYDEKYDKASLKTPINLGRPERLVFNPTTSDDPILTELIEEAKQNQEVTSVFATDLILSVLMSAPRSIYSWDLIITKKDNTIIFDKRDVSDLDFLYVDETSRDPPMFDDNKSNMNSAQNLRREATMINMCLQQQIVNRNSREHFDKQNPFQEEDQSDDKIAPVGYKYRQWKLAEDLNIIARCQVDGMDKVGGSTQHITIRAINEYQQKDNVDWKNKLDAQRGAIFMNELKNNWNKFTRWTAQALLSGCEQLKLGFVSRSNFANSNSHVILSIDKYAPLDFAKQIEMNIKNIWGIIKNIVQQVAKYPDGQFVLLKDPVKTNLLLYSVPEGETIDAPEVAPAEDDLSDADTDGDMD